MMEMELANVQRNYTQQYPSDLSPNVTTLRVLDIRLKSVAANQDTYTIKLLP